MNPTDADRYRRSVDQAKKQLENGTWPEVMMIFGYKNHTIPRANDDEFDRIATLFQNAKYDNIATFTRIVQMAEAECDVTMSFNLSMRYRSRANESFEHTEVSAIEILSCPDIMVGSQDGAIGAIHFLNSLSSLMYQIPSENMQILNNIFGDALKLLDAPIDSITIRKMVDIVFANTSEYESS